MKYMKFLTIPYDQTAIRIDTILSIYVKYECIFITTYDKPTDDNSWLYNTYDTPDDAEVAFNELIELINS